MKIDIAVQSYKKPELLLYTLLTLQKHSQKHIETVYINDDCSNDGTLDFYQSVWFESLFPGWKIKVRQNTKPVRWPVAFVFGYWPPYMKPAYFIKWAIRNVFSGRSLFYPRKDVRYQWAIDSSDKEWIMLIHDDIEFRSDVIGKYIETAHSDRKMAIVGDMGQCWRCGYHKEPSNCNPEKIMDGYRPRTDWPKTLKEMGGHGRECRINEWCCLISKQAVLDIIAKDRAFFGNFDDYGDIGAYWFDRIIARGYSFSDPYPEPSARDKAYKHCWIGFSVHSVWTEQNGIKKSEYDKQYVKDVILDKFNIKVP